MHTAAYNFGRTLMQKMAQGPQGSRPAPALPPKPAPAPTPAQPPAPRSFFQEWMNPPKPARSSGAPTNSSPFLNTLDRWYNPWTKQTGRERGETGLMRAGQVAMGTGAVAGAAAGGLAAAPALGGTTAGATPLFGTTNATGAMLPTFLPGSAAATAGTTAGTVAAGSQTPAGQNLLQRGSQMLNQAAPAAQNMMNRANTAINTYQTRVEPAFKSIGYKPEDLAMDAYAAGTGNFDKVKGPSWGLPSMAPKGMEMPIGAPGLPKPLETWKHISSLGGPLGLPQPVARMFGAKTPAPAGVMQMRQ